MISLTLTGCVVRQVVNTPLMQWRGAATAFPSVILGN
ncbi:hypothetical protein Vspart_01307 [Vibrio spartinae]|uniref:Uncharacterized protein n=1 Tax=Vibrio spartinae TaxID=1918945 RepID=A0A1N6M7K4_9VIBR|nr:hypothetical protein Vspart_01307 [Vibrio spartinae]SIO95326.1 hypothetical protein VSP9026_03068 [Vibrio spartinae]